MTPIAEMARTRVAGLVLVPLLALGALGLSSCSANRGTEASQQFTSAVRGLQGVTEVSASGSNNLPFNGSGSATVTVDPALDMAALKKLARQIGDVASGQGGMSWNSIELALGKDTLTIVPQRADITDARLDRLAGLRETGRFSELHLGDGLGNLDQDVVGVVEGGSVCELESAYDVLAKDGWPDERGRHLTVAAAYSSGSPTAFGDGRGPVRPGPVGRAVFKAVCDDTGGNMRSVQTEGEKLHVRVYAASDVGEIKRKVQAVPGSDAITLDVIVR